MSGLGLAPGPALGPTPSSTPGPTLGPAPGPSISPGKRYWQLQKTSDNFYVTIFSLFLRISLGISFGLLVLILFLLTRSW